MFEKLSNAMKGNQNARKHAVAALGVGGLVSGLAGAAARGYGNAAIVAKRAAVSTNILKQSLTAPTYRAQMKRASLPARLDSAVKTAGGAYTEASKKATRIASKLDSKVARYTKSASALAKSAKQLDASAAKSLSRAIAARTVSKNFAGAAVISAAGLYVAKRDK